MTSAHDNAQDAPPLRPSPTTLIIGAGFAGLACARRLAARGESLLVLDKGRGPGGRASTRRVDLGDDGRAASLHFDHGAQYFTARGDGFVAQVDAWRAADLPIASPWDAHFATLDGATARHAQTSPGDTLWVGTPTMSTLLDALGDGLDVRYGRRAVGLERIEASWRVTVEGPAGEESAARETSYDRLVLATPAPQAADLLESIAEPPRALGSLSERLRAVRYEPCWAVLAALPRAQVADLPFDAAFVDGSPLGWIAANDSKPGRTRRDYVTPWTLHATPDWSREHLDDDPQSVVRALLDAFGRSIDRVLEPSALPSVRAHRWLYARVEQPLDTDGDGWSWHEELGLGVCGDGCLGPRIEAAWTSGDRLGSHLTRVAGR
ncbi:MAG: FAD-dependent oxidoreductase [Acidobacteriota bacterium]